MEHRILKLLLLTWEVEGNVLIYTIIKNEFSSSYIQKNVKELMDSNGIRILVDLLTLAHLHTSRATVPLQV